MKWAEKPQRGQSCCTKHKRVFFIHHSSTQMCQRFNVAPTARPSCRIMRRRLILQLVLCLLTQTVRRIIFSKLEPAASYLLLWAGENDKLGSLVRDFSRLSWPPLSLSSATSERCRLRPRSSVSLHLMPSHLPSLFFFFFFLISVVQSLSPLSISPFSSTIKPISSLSSPVSPPQCGHGLDNYITPEQWRSARTRCLTQVGFYLPILSLGTYGTLKNVRVCVGS